MVQYNKWHIIFSRAYIETIRNLLKVLPPDDRKEVKVTPRKLLAYGFVHQDIEKEYKAVFKEVFDKLNKDAEPKPLTFQELSTYGIFFKLNPDRIAGEVMPTTSIMFPLKMKGNKETILKAINQALSQNKSNSVSTKKLSLKLKLAAAASASARVRKI